MEQYVSWNTHKTDEDFSCCTPQPAPDDFSFPSHHFSSLTNVIISLPSHKWALSKLAEPLLCQSFSEVYNRQTSMIFWTLIIKTLQPEITWPPLPDKMKTCKEIVSRTSSVQTSDEQRTITDSDQIYRKLSFFLS